MYYIITTNSRVLQCGHLSSFFNVGRGCRQGDPLSPYIFILCAEILAIKIRNKNRIKGIMINNTEIKLSSFADDTSLALDGSESSLKNALDELTTFEKTIGFKS